VGWEQQVLVGEKKHSHLDIFPNLLAMTIWRGSRSMGIFNMSRLINRWGDEGRCEVFGAGQIVIKTT
jgi:hypothetical protein